MSPNAHSILGSERSERSLAARWRQRTSYPLFNNKGTTREPVNPVAPVTKIFIITHSPQRRGETFKKLCKLDVSAVQIFFTNFVSKSNVSFSLSRRSRCVTR